MHKADIRIIASWKSAELNERICAGVKSLAQMQTLSERRGIRLAPMAYEVIGRKLALYQRTVVKLDRIAKGWPPFIGTPNQ